MKTLRVNTFALKNYKSFVKDNFHLTISEVEKKLTRNVLLSKKVGEIENQTLYAYGKLRILVQDNSTITCVMNHQKKLDDWELDLEKKAILDKIFGIAQ